MRPLIAITCSLSDGDGATRDAVPHAYADSVLRAGGAPYLVPCVGDEDAVLQALQPARGLIITGGVDVDPQQYGESPRRELGAICPARDALDEVVVRYALAHPDLPALGICRGIQALNVFAGGTLIQDIPSQVPGALKHSQQAPGWHGTHEITPEPGSVFAATVGEEPLRTNTFHHQAVQQVAEGFAVAARAADGVVEALERVGARYCLGVQFHPELMASKCPRLMRLFERLVAEAH